MPAVQTGFADINGAKLYYETAGDGQPFVMVHAGVTDCRLWDGQFRFFAERCRIIRYDMRGYGRSAPVPGAFSHLDDLTALLDFLQVDRAYLMGCSRGGGLCMDLALARPDKAAALIMVCSGPSGFEFDTPAPPQWQESVEAFKAGDMERVAELEAQIWMDGRGRTADQVDPAVRNRMKEMNLIALRNEKAALGKEKEDDVPPAAPRLGELKLPTLVIVGGLDTPYLIAAADHMAEHIAGAQKVVIPNTAHLPSMEHPAQFNQMVSDFLNRL
jgi:pimeloyl-ACP methyl ester carboxylesterase